MQALFIGFGFYPQYDGKYFKQKIIQSNLCIQKIFWVRNREQIRENQERNEENLLEAIRIVQEREHGGFGEVVAITQRLRKE